MTCDVNNAIVNNDDDVNNGNVSGRNRMVLWVSECQGSVFTQGAEAQVEGE